MSRVTREQAMTALFALVSGSSSFVTTSRRFHMPDQIPASMQPALLMCEPDEDHQKQKLITPAVRYLSVEIWIYISDGTDPNNVPAITLNNMIDAIDPISGGVLAPGLNGRQTLGGLVADCYIDGKINKVPGDIDGQGIARIPVKVMFMQP